MQKMQHDMVTIILQIQSDGSAAIRYGNMTIVVDDAEVNETTLADIIETVVAGRHGLLTPDTGGQDVH